MSYQYTIEDLARLCQVSKQSIYNLINKNKEFVNENSRKQGRKVKYNQAVLDLFLEYYGKQNQEKEPEETPAPQPEAQEAPGDATEDPGRPEEQEETSPSVEALQGQIKALEAEIIDLRLKLERAEAERQGLIQQNGITLLLLQQEKQEKLRLLPPPQEAKEPKKSFAEKVKGLFGKKES